MHMHPERNMSSHLLLFLPPASCFRIKRAEGRCSLGHQHSFLHEQKSSGLGDREILARPCRCLPFLFPLWLPILDTTVQPLSLTQHLKFSARVARRGAFFFLASNTTVISRLLLVRSVRGWANGLGSWERRVKSKERCSLRSTLARVVSSNWGPLCPALKARSSVPASFYSLRP